MKVLTIISAIFISVFFCPGAFATEPVITVRFANPEYSCATQKYTVDVEFQSNQENVQLFGMNVRFFYEESVLEFYSFGEFAEGYAAVNPYPPTITTGNAAGGAALFGFSGPQEYVNGAIEKILTSTVVLSVSGWTKLFNVSFQIDDPEAFNVDAFCPSLIWDLKENGSGGIAAGIVMTIVSGEGTAPAIEQCLQINWQYDGIPGLPHGNPAITDCINTICAYAPDTHLPTFGATTPGIINLPVTVTGFSLISGFNLTFEYDSTTMSYAGNTPNSIFTPQNGLLTVSVIPGTDGKKKVLMSYDGVAITLGDNSQLVNFQFNYISGGTNLTWLTGGTECVYFDASGHHAYDLPNTDYYFNGEVISLSAPFSKIDSVTSFSGDYVTFPVRVWNFRNVLSGHLTLNYPAGNLTYVDAVQDPALPLNFQDNVTTPGTLVLTWSGTGLTLPNGYTIAYLTFLYSGGSSNLTWYNNGSSCQYVNSVLLVPFTDVPTQNFYQNGNVSSANFYWSGQTSQDWNNPGNWSGNIVPYQPVNVIIDNSLNPQHWPLFSGNLGIGNECNNIMLTGPGQLSVSGDLIIEPGHDLVISGPGHILTGGSWINSGNFQPGTGTIEFTGNGIVEIPNGVPPAQYIESYQVAEFPKNMTLISDLSEGPYGDNAHADVSIGFNFKYLGIDYTQVRINTNGWISFNLSGEDLTSGNNINLFTQDLPATALAPWWDDLKANAVNNINYVTEGIAPNRVFTVEWKNVYSYRINATTRLFFQVKLYETTNIIEFCYGNNVAGTVNTAEGASIGIKDSTGGQGHFIEATQNSSYNVLPVLKCTTNWPTVNYRFTPATQSSNEVFNRLINSKTGGELRILKDVTITGTE